MLALVATETILLNRHSIQVRLCRARDGTQLWEVDVFEEKQPAVYIMANRYRGAIYIGVTSALWNRVQQHKLGEIQGFTADYGLKMLVWYAHFDDMQSAIKRETQMKVWRRSWKIELIEGINRDWLDLTERIEHRPHVAPKLGSISRLRVAPAWME